MSIKNLYLSFVLFFYQASQALAAASPSPSSYPCDGLNGSGTKASGAVPNCIYTHPTQIRIFDFQVILNTLTGNFLNVFYLLMGIATVSLVIYGGFLYITSAGSPEKIKTGRQSIINAIGAIVLVTVAFFVLRLVLSVIQVLIPAA